MVLWLVFIFNRLNNCFVASGTSDGLVWLMRHLRPLTDWLMASNKPVNGF